jgi:hypothetical protein
MSAFDVVDGARFRQQAPRVIVAVESHKGAVHMQISTIGLDIAKYVFQVHGIDVAEQIIVRKPLRRSKGDGVLPGVGAVPHRHGGLCRGAPLGASCRPSWVLTLMKPVTLRCRLAG